MTASAVELNGINKSYENVVAVDSLDLIIPSGSTYGVWDQTVPARQPRSG
jgi:hypothetical protein